MSKDNLKGSYTIEKFFLDEMLADNVKKIDILRSLLQYCLGEKNVSDYDVHLLCENFVVNYKILTLIKTIYQRSPRAEKPRNPDKEELIVSSSDMFMLQTLALAKHYALRDLRDTTNLSISIH